MHRMNAVRLLAKKDVMRTLKTPGAYMAFILACIAILVYSWIFTQIRGGLGPAEDLSEAFISVSLWISISIFSLYIAVSSVNAIARERQDRTLEVLFYGPVDERSFILGKYVAKMIIYILLMAAAVVFIAALSIILGVGISQTLIKLPIMSVLLASCIISLGIMLSALTSGVTSAIFLLIVFMAAMVGIKIAGLILALIPGFIHPLVSAAKDISVTLLSVTQFISPVEYLGLGLYAINSSDPLSYLEAFLYPAAYTAALLLLSTYIIRRRGVR